MLIDDYRAIKEKKYTEMINYERNCCPAEKVSVPTSAGIIDGYIYLPDHLPDRPLPVMFNLHGGGFVLGFCEQDGKYCRRLANSVPCAVVNIDYCLAPEHKFPLPVTSTYEFIDKLAGNFSHYGFDRSKIVIGGTVQAGIFRRLLHCLPDRTGTYSLPVRYWIIRR